MEPEPGLLREPYRLLRVEQTATGSSVDTVGRFLGAEFFTTDVGEGLRPYLVPFGPVELHASSVDRIFVVESFTGEVSAYDYRGELREIIRPK